ncbi:beta-lactamase-like protein [Gamsiella multidivaricata]|uniref:beta-lactamase-like protein n=1 Tax=Gamsiella multidivaricata TaxID=101098 RepID=UPI00221FE373|nr:beta-lactamase-like protein [Gamsiella multidivaricata]KAG0368706.1 hypothetical protein BGZ54_001348 [Gamsiella multidivaricata]KAI7830500.1 beta-lactamase-like protein [Gamsiella multidivaricata]
MGAVVKVVPDQDEYLEIRPGLFRSTIILTAGPLGLPIATFLIKGNPVPDQPEAHEWLMVDAGAPPHADMIVQHVKAVLKHPKDSLKYICITHAHLDHIGASIALLDAYPGCMVVSHPEEKPFLCDGMSFKCCAGDTWIFNIMKHFMKGSKIRVPEHRTLLLREGDEWEYSGLVKVVETHGHTPGSISFLHVPTRSIMIGDASKNHMFLYKEPHLSYPLPIGTCHMGNAIKSMDKIISLNDHVDTIFPAHDYSPEGISVAQLQGLRASDPR